MKDILITFGIVAVALILIAAIGASQPASLAAVIGAIIVGIVIGKKMP